MKTDKINQIFLQSIKKNNRNLNRRAIKGKMFDKVVRVPEQLPSPDYLQRRTASIVLNALKKFTGLFVIT